MLFFFLARWAIAAASITAAAARKVTETVPDQYGAADGAGGLTRICGLATVSCGVAHAEPPPADPSPARYGGKGTPDLGPSSIARLSRTGSLGKLRRDVDEGRMTANRNLKRRVRARAAKTGESYAAALRHIRPPHQEGIVSEVNLVRLATAQVAVREDPRDSGQLHQSGRDVRELMRQARLTPPTNGLWISFAITVQHSVAAPSGTIAPDGHWAVQCPGDGHPAVAVADIDNRPESIDIAITRARPWRRQARAGVYDAHLVTDDRSDNRSAF